MDDCADVWNKLYYFCLTADTDYSAKGNISQNKNVSPKTFAFYNAWLCGMRNKEIN